MKLSGIVFTVVCTALVTGGCHPAPTLHRASPVSISAPTTLEQACNARPWPQPVPDPTGGLIDQALHGSLFCFNLVAALDDGGDDVLHDITSRAPDYRITSITPPAGTFVSRDSPITVTVAALNPTAPPAFRPCDWVTRSEAARFMGIPSVTASAWGDQAGSVDQMCDYTSPGRLVISELMMPGSVPVDPRTTFDMVIAGGHGSEVSGLPDRGYCTRDTSMPVLVVLLHGDRLYQATDDNCDVLRQFAQAAITRIGA